MSESPTPPVELSSGARLQRSGSVRFEPMDDGCALYDPGTGQVYILNLIAAYLWTEFDGHRTLRDLIDEIRRRLRPGGQSPYGLDRDIRILVSDLLRAGLVRLRKRAPVESELGSRPSSS